jgi:hypothetical protein
MVTLPSRGAATQTARVDRTDIHRRRVPVDLATVLAIVVAALIVFSGYFLFNGVPTFKNDAARRRTTRRT